MKSFFLILPLFVLNSACQKNKPDTNPSITMSPGSAYTFLALGDSYTIGQSVPVAENFPNQTVALLKSDSLNFVTRIIATTGWTTDELEAGITTANATDPLQPSYNFVSLLIGVNNQYRGRPVDVYKAEFEELLKKAIRFAGNKADYVVVLSIPDWGVTPFGGGADRDRVAREIDAYNAVNKQIALQYNVHYMDITPWTREAANDLSLVAADGLHPSGKEYKRWAESIALYFKSKL